MPEEELTSSPEAVPPCPEEGGRSTDLPQSGYKTGGTEAEAVAVESGEAAEEDGADGEEDKGIWRCVPVVCLPAMAKQSHGEYQCYGTTVQTVALAARSSSSNGGSRNSSSSPSDGGGGNSSSSPSDGAAGSSDSRGRAGGAAGSSDSGGRAGGAAGSSDSGGRAGGGRLRWAPFSSKNSSCCGA
ncbi:UNVERIFIED_CONTAM: hypothetical protein FKN15_060434 [Acipenser sinensis]